MNKKAARLVSASVIAAAGIYLLIALLNSMRPVIEYGFFLVPGQFLYFCFLEASFYLPLLFLISSFLLFADYYNYRVFFAKLFSLVPFFTFSLLLRILDYIPGSPAADAIIGGLGIRGGSMVLGLLLIPEVLVFLKILMFRTGPRERKPFYKGDSVEPQMSPDSETGDSSLISSGEAESHRFEPVPLELSVKEFPPDAVPAVDEESVPDAEPVSEEPEQEEPEQDTDEDVFEDLPSEFDTEEYEPVTEPLDLDPDAGEIEEDAENSDEPDDIIEEIEDDFSPIPPKPEGEESYPDAPVRGDEEEITKAAREVWADAEQLGFDDVMPEAIRIEEPDEDETADTTDDDIEELRLDIDLNETFLEIPDITTEPSSEMVSGVVAELNQMEASEEFNWAEDDDPEDSDLEILEPVEVEEPAPVEAVKPRRKPRQYVVPVKDLLQHYEDDSYWVVDKETKAASEILRETLEEFKIAAEVTGISKGPVITMFEILPAPGVKLSKIVNLADNIALRLAASRVRIVAPIPGKHAVGIEVPNKNRAIVSFREIIEEETLNKSRMDIPVVLGKDITGGSRIIDLVQTPHLLIAGATGSGKSVCVNSLICSVLYSRTPEQVKMILIDPKIVELKMYNDIPHLLTPVITEPKKAFQSLQYATCEMERRYSLLNAIGVRDIKAYNRKVRDSNLATDTLPYIVIIVDEFADLMATTGKELESVISRLAAMSRAVGIHLVLATQRPSVDVITGLIKANIPSRIAFMVASKTDSRIIIDSMGADKLLGKGDMLFTSAWDPNPVRIQGAFLSDDEVERVTDHVKTLGEPEYIDDEIFISDGEDGEFELESAGSDDPLMDPAIQIVVEAGKASASYLQRRLKIGYNRAARLVEEMEYRGIVGPANGSKPREIIHIPDRV